MTPQVLETIENLKRSVKKSRARGEQDPTKLLQNWRFVGSPGTGKTTVARAFGEVLQGLGLLLDSKVTEVRAMQLMGSFVGSTAPLVEAKMNEALGGILFIDEVYYFNENAYGRDAIGTLLGNLTDPKYAGKLAVVVAGYDHQIHDMMQLNPGLTGRFTEEMFFPDWSAEECLQLVLRKAAKEDVQLPDALHDAVVAGFRQLIELPNFQNARDAVTLFDKMNRSRDRRADDEGVVHGPFLALDVRTAFDAVIRQRAPRPGARSRESSPPGVSAAAPPQALAQARVPASAPRVIATERQQAETQQDRATCASGAPTSGVAVLASLERAFVELGYDLYRQRDVVTSQHFPAELLALVARQLSTSPETVSAVLAPQCPPLVPKYLAAIVNLEQEMQRRREADAAIAGVGVSDQAQASAMMQQEVERRKQWASRIVCVICGQAGCPVQPVEFRWDADGPAPDVQLATGGSVNAAFARSSLW